MYLPESLREKEDWSEEKIKEIQKRNIDYLKKLVEGMYK